ncbi:hypothetical protein [Haloactinopolyspora sp.]|uniref:hypothetical protein n=1 Tax=Haloactinopolyspora sp. TaxID=1966353 RepID=UPI00262A9D31|nr:hypothetical protein [Haloactinopolyspora sp.]
MPATYRVDKFTVPDGVRDEFWMHIRRTHSILRKQHGFVDDVLLEQHSGTGHFAIVTIVQWSSAADLAAAKVPVEQAHREAAFVPAEFIERHGIVADMGNYEAVQPAA